MNNEIIGRIIFFLYPLSIIEELAKELIRNEYEVYLINDKDIMIELLKIYDKSILYINIDEASLNEKGWEKYILKIQKDENLNKKVDIGLLTYRRKENLIKKYLFDIGIKCGYVELNLKLSDTIYIIMKTLEVNEAKGRRSYIRVKCGNNAKFNIHVKDPSSFIKYQINGIISDISSFGMACEITEDKYKGFLSEKMKLDSIQLNLRGLICIIKGEIFLKRGNMYIIKFNLSAIPDIKNKIYQFIYNELQNNIKKEMEVIKKRIEKDKINSEADKIDNKQK